MTTHRHLTGFGRQCVASTNWGGQVPLILATAHLRLSTYIPKEERTNYWLRPGVWTDIKKSYDTYFDRNPGRRSRNAQFARYAYRCEQWDVFLDHVDQLSASYRENFFGGKDEHERMLRVAKENSGRAN